MTAGGRVGVLRVPRPRLADVVRTAALLVGSAVALFPLAYMLDTALRPQRDYLFAPFGFPASLYLENFGRAIGTQIGQWILNSTIVTVGSVALVMVSALFASYVFVRLPFPGSKTLLRAIVALMIVPPIVMLIPLFTLMVDLGRVNHFDSVVISYAALMFPFSVFLLARFVETVPDELVEAAVIDGAGHLRIIWSIIVPLARPALITLSMVNILWAWNELLIAVVMLQEESSRTLQAGLALLQGRNTVDVPLVMAGAALSAAPMLLLFLLTQRYFKSGLLEGALRE